LAEPPTDPGWISHPDRGPKCKLAGGTFLENLGAGGDSSRKWLAAKVPFSTTARRLRALSTPLVKSYSVRDVLRNTNETNTIVLDRTITVTTSGG
jgi:hypothetical protein